MDFNSAAVIHDKLIALHCAPTCVGDYVSCWRSGLNHLASAGHLFDHVDSLWHFIKHLPIGLTFNIIHESVLYSLSTACSAEQLPTFESVVEHINNVKLNHAYFQPSCLCHIASDTLNLTVPHSRDNITTQSTATTTQSTSQP